MIYVGSKLTVRAKFYALNLSTGEPVYALADPTTVRLIIQPRSGEALVKTWSGENGDITKVDDGIFTADIEPDQFGDWWCRWEGTGAVKAVVEFSFSVEKQHAFAPVG